VVSKGGVFWEKTLKWERESVPYTRSGMVKVRGGATTKGIAERHFFPNGGTAGTTHARKTEHQRRMGAPQGDSGNGLNTRHQTQNLRTGKCQDPKKKAEKHGMAARDEKGQNTDGGQDGGGAGGRGGNVKPQERGIGGGKRGSGST